MSQFQVVRQSLLPIIITLLTFAALAYHTESASAQVVWHPDIIVRAQDLYNNDIVSNIEPGRTHLRFSNGTANVGLGRLHLIGILPPVQESTGTYQLVRQVIYYSDGSRDTVDAGTFTYHSSHSHTHFDNWSKYRLREYFPGDSVGDVVAEGAKTSFCILDLTVYNSSLPNYSPQAYFTQCGSQVQGLSVGWLDLYSKTLPGQNIDITDLPDGIYWLESEVDPDNDIIESDETNNITRIKVSLGAGGPLAPDDYEPNDSRSSVKSLPLGTDGSANLGPCGPRTLIGDLSVHSSGNADYFRFYLNSTGAASDSLRIDFVDQAGDVDMRLLDTNGAILASSETSFDFEYISLLNRPEGWYYLYIFGFNGATNPEYSLIINPPANAAPAIDVIDPPVGVTERVHGFQNYTVTWSASDPESDSTWVTVFLDKVPVLDGDEFEIDESILTPADAGFHVINSAGVSPDTYWVYCRITDGGTITGSWSDGQIAFLSGADTDADGVFDFEDNCIGWSNPGQEPGCTNHGDPVPDGMLDVSDVVLTIDIAFRKGAPRIDADCPHGNVGRTDLNCDGATDVGDVVMMVDATFRGTAPAFCNPCACPSYPSNCP